MAAWTPITANCKLYDCLVNHWDTPPPPLDTYHLVFGDTQHRLNPFTPKSDL